MRRGRRTPMNSERYLGFGERAGLVIIPSPVATPLGEARRSGRQLNWVDTQAAKRADCKSAGVRLRGFESLSAHYAPEHGRLRRACSCASWA